MTKHGSRVDSKRDLTAIHTSYLKRAFDTAAILYGHQKDLRPSFDSSELLRELNFGRAKGNSISFNSIPGLTWEQNAAEGIYLAMYDDDDRFPKEKASRILLFAQGRLLKNSFFPVCGKIATCIPVLPSLAASAMAYASVS